MVFRCYTEKKPGFDVEARLLLKELRDINGISSVSNIRILNRYDVEGIGKDTFEDARTTVFSQPQSDFFYDRLPFEGSDGWILAVESLPGQYDQRADSCAQCIQMLKGGDRPTAAVAKVYAFAGGLSEGDKEKIRLHLINPVESRQAPMALPATLQGDYPPPEPVGKVKGLIRRDQADLEEIRADFGLAMELDDLCFVQDYFKNQEGRDPTETELRVIDTYWSDHCRHTTFNTHIDSIDIRDDRVKAAYRGYLDARSEVYEGQADRRPQTLMDLATIGAKLLKKRGKLPNLDESEEVNACSVKIKANIDGQPEDWLLMFKNETHNHPTEIEPFGGAATCVGGAIRDPLSGRAYVYQAMRITGAGDPTAPIDTTLPGKLPQRKLTVTAAAGYSSYGNQIGVATGLVREIYHPGYIAKRMEVGAVVGAVPAKNVVRQAPTPGDQVILLGGRTGRDGIGGATGSSKTHNLDSVTESAAEVQKGNAPEERKIQRLFRKPEVTRMIKRCNDFGAGGVSVAIGELADGLHIDLDQVRTKYKGLSGTEIAISESQERMAAVVAPENVKAFIQEAEKENLEAYVVAKVTADARMKVVFDGQVIADLDREFLSSNGATKHAAVSVPPLGKFSPRIPEGTPMQQLKAVIPDLNVASLRGLAENFDFTVGAGTVIAPYGGRYQLTPSQVMAALIPSQKGDSSTCHVMSYGFDPCRTEANPFEGSRYAVILSAAKLVAAGCRLEDIYLSFQEYFERLRKEPERWGKPFSALLGALDAQMGLEIAAIGGKDSMSGSFMELDVPPTLISFSIAAMEAKDVISSEFKLENHYVYLLDAGVSYDSIRQAWKSYKEIASFGSIHAAWAVAEGGIYEAIFKMCLGNGLGFEAAGDLAPGLLLHANPGSIVLESAHPIHGALLLGKTIAQGEIRLFGETASLDELCGDWEAPLEGVFPTKTGDRGEAEKISFEKKKIFTAAGRFASPLAVIPVFPGTNCEYDTARAIERAGGQAEMVIIRNLSPACLAESVSQLTSAMKRAQMVVLPGGSSGGDEPDGSGKFIASLFRNPGITDAVHELLYQRDGLMLGICNGFQALIKLGLVPYGEIRPLDSSSPILTYNTIGRHQSKYVTIRISSCASPWLRLCNVGDLYRVPFSHGEGRFVAEPALLAELISKGQIAAQYTDGEGNPSMDIRVNPNGSVMAVEGLLSPDGRVFGKMGHAEREGSLVCRNIPGNKAQPIFESGVSYYL